MTDPVVHLHVHTEFSLLDGAARIEDVVKIAAEDGQPAIASTDHGNMYGVPDMAAACEKAGIKYAPGTELYMVDDRTSRKTRKAKSKEDDGGGDDDDGEKLYYHLTTLAENDEGYRNLMQLSSKAFLEGYYYKPRCLTPFQQILTLSGPKFIKDIKVGDFVLTHNGAFSPVMRTMSREVSEELYGIELNNRYGDPVWMTGEHPILVRHRDGTTSWVEAKDVEAGRANSREEISSWNSFACFPKLQTHSELTHLKTDEYTVWRHLRGNEWVKPFERPGMGPSNHYCNFPNQIKLTYEFGYWLGLYIAEGHTAANELSITANKAETQLVDFFAEFAKRVLGLEAKERTRQDRPSYNGVTTTIYSTIAAEIVGDLCGRGAQNKKLPEFFDIAPPQFRQGLFNGVLAGDGSIKDDCIIFTQTSETLAWQMKLLAAEFTDSFASIKRCDDRNPNHSVQYRSNYSTGKGGRKTISDDKYVYRPISAVHKKHYSGPVYNIEVYGDHSYVTDFAVHNCDWELLEQHKSGLIVTTGCLGGMVLQRLMRDDYAGGLQIASNLKDIFTAENLFVEIQDHGIPEQLRTNPMLVKLANELGLGLVATNDSHYVHQHDAIAHDALLCVNTGAKIHEENRFKFHGDQHYFKSSQEMRDLFAEFEGACDNTLAIAERFSVNIESPDFKLPKFPLPEKYKTATEYLTMLVNKGAEKRWGTIDKATADRISFELSVIEQMGFSDYFLIVWDLCRYARSQGVRVGPGRGSAAGSAVSYCLKITDIDPIKYDLLFERFLNPSRISMPDIDLDIETRFRDEWIRYTTEKYGDDRVCQIITYQTIKARAAVRDATRVLDKPYFVGDMIVKAMPPVIMGRDTPLSDCFDPDTKNKEGYASAKKLRELIDDDEEAAQIMTVARGLEGLRRQDSIHAAAVVIADRPLTEVVPVQRKPKKGSMEGQPLVTQYEMHAVEDLGLLKMDYLGLRNLDVITDTLRMVEEETGEVIDIDNVPLDDEATFKLFQDAKTVGVFQLESAGIQELVDALKPSTFHDVAALVALYRPGPMAANMHFDYANRKNGKQKVSYMHADAEEILSPTFGLMIYQEQMMRVAQKFAGYSLAEADNLRKACGKKIRELMAKERDKFIEGAVKTGYGAAVGKQWFDLIEPFADYSFNKSHSYGYGFISYQTAYLKANYPTYYMAALLTSVKDKIDRMAVYLNECRLMGISVLVPDVNSSMRDFVGKEDSIPFGLSAIKGIGEKVVELIIEEREKNGLFESFEDFCNRVPLSALKKNIVENLIRGGAFDSLGYTRMGLMQTFEQILGQTTDRRKKESKGQFDLFGTLDENPFELTIEIPNEEWPKEKKLEIEREALGLYVSDHPLRGVENMLANRTNCTLADIQDRQHGDRITIGGLLMSVEKKFTKKNDLMAILQLEDLFSTVEVVVFPKTLPKVEALLKEGKIVTATGRIDVQGERTKFLLDEMQEIRLIIDDGVPLHLDLNKDELDTVEELKNAFDQYPGKSTVFIHYGDKVFQLPEEFNVEVCPQLTKNINAILGRG